MPSARSAMAIQSTVDGSSGCHMRHTELPPILSSIVRELFESCSNRIRFCESKLQPIPMFSAHSSCPAQWERTTFFFIAVWIATMMGLQSMWTLVHHQTNASTFDSDAECDNLYKSIYNCAHLQTPVQVQCSASIENSNASSAFITWTRKP